MARFIAQLRTTRNTLIKLLKHLNPECLKLIQVLRL
jgi:hypothetical protein